MNFKTFEVDKRIMSLRVEGNCNNKKVVYEYVIIGWSTTSGDYLDSRYDPPNRQVFPVCLSERALPVSIYEITDELMHDGWQNITYTYLVNGEIAYSKCQKSEIKPEANKPLLRKVNINQTR